MQLVLHQLMASGTARPLTCPLPALLPAARPLARRPLSAAAARRGAVRGVRPPESQTLESCLRCRMGTEYSRLWLPLPLWLSLPADTVFRRMWLSRVVTTAGRDVPQFIVHGCAKPKNVGGCILQCVYIWMAYSRYTTRVSYVVRS